MSIFYPQEEHQLYHHGILGMKWGIRRFQPYPSDYKGNGKYTGKEYRADRKIQKKLTKEAYNAGRFRAMSDRDIEKLSNKRGLFRNNKRLESAKLDRAFWNKEYNKSQQQLDEHVAKMNKKYGKENVRQTRYKTVKGQKGAAERVVADPNSKAKKIAAGLGIGALAFADRGVTGLKDRSLLSTLAGAKSVSGKNYKPNPALTAAVVGTGLLSASMLKKAQDDWARKNYKYADRMEYHISRDNAKKKKR